MLTLVRWRRQLAVLLAVIGPGIVAANSDNDAGGITTLSVAGGEFGHQLLWILFLITISLAITQEIGARTGAITGKGLAALIRENYGVRITFFAMAVLLVANLGTIISEFAGVAAALELFNVPRELSVPTAALAVWLVVTRGTYKRVERVFLVISAIYVCYVIAAFLAQPDWGAAVTSLVTPTIRIDAAYLVMAVQLVGTTITPWGQFFIQAYVVDKGITDKEYHITRKEVYAGALLTDSISFFIIVTTTATLYANGIHIEDASDAARALQPLAGPLARQVFAVGLLNASLLGAAVVPLSTVYPICEAFGWEAGVSKTFRQAPVFNGLYAFLIALGALAVLVPALDLVTIILLAQTVNGILLPIILVFAIQLSSSRNLMGAYANGPIRNMVVWATAVLLIGATVALLATSVVLPLFGINFGA